MPLPTAPENLHVTRKALHSVAEQVLAPVRVQATGNEIALTARGGGVGTPDLPDGGWVGFADAELLVTTALGEVTATPLTSLRAAAAAAALRSADELPDEPLPIDSAAAHFLDEVFAFALDALEALRAEAAGADDPSPVRLWPEHFDIAYEQGDEAAGTRAGYGVSPGDELHPQPYAYVTPWKAPPADPDLWNAAGFQGAELTWAQLAAAEDPLALLLRFWRERRDAIAS